uniref:Putative ribonuclease H-like domain-containing protein n=1 Tax=Tanacetum cinerariifolium TaxID=118510 RepID=A0A6L2JJ03_TANCI|nr:putative ribonuclease H-like domain-containing protein [Tanacetum cinerariifolium]
MSTRSSARNLFPPLDNPELTIRRRSRADPTLLNDFEMVAEGNGDPPVPDLQTMEELCQPSFEWSGGPIALIVIQAMNFGLKNDMIQQSMKVNGVTDDALRLYLFPHSLTHHATAWFDRLPRNSINTFEQMAKKFLGKYFPPSMVTKLRNEITNFRQRGTFMKRRLKECYDLIVNMTTHHNDWDTLAQRSEPSSSITSSSDQEIVALKIKMAEINKNLMRVLQPLLAKPRTFMLREPIKVVIHTNLKANEAILKNMQTNMTSLTNSNLELKNMFSQFMKMNIASSLGLGTLPSNTITNPKEDLKGITTLSETANQGPTIPTTSSSLPKVVERETSTKDVQPLVIQVKSPIPNSEPVVAPIIGPVVAPENPFSDTEVERIFDSGCSRSMTGNNERLDDFQVIQCGKVTFGVGEGRITGKGTIRTLTLDFENIYYVKELQQFNLFSISQICDKKNRVLFTDTECLVLSKDFKLLDDSMVVLRVPRKHNFYTINLNNLCPRGNLACLVAYASVDESVKWHRRMGHVNYKNINRLVKGNLVRGLPLKLFKNDHTCVACCKGKQHKASYKAINGVSSISKPLQLLHMDLFGPTSIRSIDHKYYCLVITDDYSRFYWVFFLEHKDSTYPIRKDFINLVENQLNKKAKAIRCDNGTEFKNAHMIDLYGSIGIKRKYSNARTPQQNRIAERKNRTLIEAARTIVLVTSPHNKTPYALLTGKITSVSHFKPFGCHVTILNTSDHLGKFDGKADEGYFIGYSASNKAYMVYNMPNKMVEESMNLSIQGTEPKDNSGDEVNDSLLNFADKIFQKEPARLKVPTGGVPVPTGYIPVPADATMVSTDDVPVHTSSSTDSFFDDEPTTRFPCPSDLGNHNPSPGANKDRKFTTGGSEYVVAANCFGQPNGSRWWISAFQVLFMDQLGPLAIQATIDKTPYTITEDLVRSQLQLADDGGIDDLPNAELYSGMDNLGTKSGSWDQFGSPIVVALICLSNMRQFNWSSYIFKGLTDAGPFTNVDDEPLDRSFHMSPPRSTQSPPVGQPSGGVEDSITLTALSYVVSNLVQKVNSLETKLKDHKKLFKDVVGKKQDVDLDTLRTLANAAVTVNSSIPPGGASNTPTASTSVHVVVPTGASTILAGSLSVPTNVPPSVTPASVSNKGKSLMVEEDIPVKARTFKQMQEDILGEQAAKRALVQANASLSKTVLGDDVSEDNFPAKMDALIKRKQQALAEKLAKEMRNRPMTQAQQRTYMTGPVLEKPSSKRQKSTEAPILTMPDVPQSPFVSSPQSSGIRRKSLGKKHLPKPKSTLQELDLDADAQTFIKIVTTEESGDKALPVWSALVGWEVILTPLGDINAIYRMDRSTSYFTTLGVILHMVDRHDLLKLYGLVVKYYENHPVVGARLIL